MTRQPRRSHGREPGPAACPCMPGVRRRPDDDGAAAAASRVGADSSGRLAYSVGEAARLTGLSRDLLYDEMRRGNLAYIKIGRRRLITLQHLHQFLGIAT